MQREGFDIARCTAERLMRERGLQGVIRGKPVKTMMTDKAAPVLSIRPAVSSMHRCRTCYGSRTLPGAATLAGFVYVSLMIEGLASCVVGRG
ncbi:Integrase [Erythrobacter dokdonensis DSW-74]|uniref:Integrase n=1 Tax=Erythrobacter dokdonensis DSW-74 TaxID=1300349 RepID=A0A1A7BG88_9SPHN|nr:Integrase [Erythrobacter dokdonensis DSW-74]